MDEDFYIQCLCAEKKKNKFVRTRISRSKLLYRDEKIRKNSFCAETGQLNHEPMQPNRQPTTKPARMAAKTTSPPCRSQKRHPPHFNTLRSAPSAPFGNNSLALAKMRSAETIGSSLYALVTCSYPHSSSGFW